jgi:hypothetical protein
MTTKIEEPTETKMGSVIPSLHEGHASQLSSLVRLSLGGFLARMARFCFTERNKIALEMLKGKPEAPKTPKIT